MRPSDIYKSKSGTFVEVSDTDAEGGLMLADALMSCTKDPDLILIYNSYWSIKVAMGLEVPSFFK